MKYESYCRTLMDGTTEYGFVFNDGKNKQLELIVGAFDSSISGARAAEITMQRLKQFEWAAQAICAAAPAAALSSTERNGQAL